jgi:hypothetical protein
MLTDCTLSGNSAGGTFGGSGGGIFNFNSGTVTLTDCTLSGNSVTFGNGDGFFNSGGSGGGIFNVGALTLANCTLSGNSADVGGGIIIAQVAGLPVAKGTAIMSLFANSAGGNLVVEPGAEFVSLGHNLFTDAPGVTLDPTDLTDTDPLLGPLADNGGPTQTMALLPGSPAIDAGVAVPGVTTDQRGVSRPQGRAPDIGAFEVQILPPTVVGLERRGIHFHPTSIIVTFSQPMDAARAESLAEYHLIGPGPDHKFGTRDDHRIRIRSARYNAATNSVVLRPVRRLPLHDKFQLTVKGTAPDGLTSTLGILLDGARTGQPGSNYVARITGSLLVPPIQHKGGKQAAVAHGHSHR